MSISKSTIANGSPMPPGRNTHPANGPSRPQPGSYVGPGKAMGAGEHNHPGSRPGPAATRKLGMSVATSDDPAPRSNPRGMRRSQAPY